MAWCFSTRASVATVLTTHPCVSRCLRVKVTFTIHFGEYYDWIKMRCIILHISHHCESCWFTTVWLWQFIYTLQWRHSGLNGVSNHQPHDCLLNRLFGHRSRKTLKLRVTGLCQGNSPGPVNSPHKWPVTRKMFPFDDLIMYHKFNVHWSLYLGLAGQCLNRIPMPA